MRSCEGFYGFDTEGRGKYGGNVNVKFMNYGVCESMRESNINFLLYCVVSI